MKNKILTFITIFLCIVAVGILSFAGYIAFRFVPAYREIMAENVTEEEVIGLKKESKQVEEKISVSEQELQGLIQRNELFSCVETEAYEQVLRNSYIAKKEVESAARSLVISELENLSYIMLPEAEQQKLSEVVMDKVIDEVTGNAIVAAGVKSAISAAAEDMTVESIINGAVKGAVAEVPDYITGEITGVAEEIIGVDIFGVAGWISDFMNADDTPVALANSMVTEQKQDVTVLLAFLEKEELTASDMQYMAGLMERIRVRGKELEAAGSSVGGDFYGAEQLERLAKLWEENNYRILQYAGLEGANNEN